MLCIDTDGSVFFSPIKNILFMQCMPANLNDDSFIDTGYPSLIVIDDLMRDAKNRWPLCI
jgi:hypothetical protein